MPKKSDKPVAQPQNDFPYDRCRIVGAAKRQCYFPATLYGLSAKPGTGECRLHYRTHGPAVEEIITESERWYDARRRGEDVPLEYTRPDGKRVPGFPGEAQREKAHKDWLAKPPAPHYGRAKAKLPLPPITREPGQDDEERTA